MGATASTCWKPSASMPGSGWPEAGEDEALGNRHAAYFVGLIREAEAAHTQTETVALDKAPRPGNGQFQGAFNWLENP